MSYDLDFWKYTTKSAHDHQAVYERRSNGEQVEGLEELPIEEMRTEIATAFSKRWTQLDPDNWESDGGSFQLLTTPQFVRVDCCGMDGDDMNRFIDILKKFGCPLYDPQVTQRFER